MFHGSTRVTFLTFLCLLCYNPHGDTGNLVAAFTPPREGRLLTAKTNPICIRTPFHVRTFAAAEPLLAADESTSEESEEQAIEKEPILQFDRNGKQFVKGAIVRVVQTTRAYQVNQNSHGTFNKETKLFEPAMESPDTPNCVGFLELPPGFRGQVMRVYDIEDHDATHPVVVKFTKGKNTEEGYEPPCTFLMHFESHEVECVE